VQQTSQLTTNFSEEKRVEQIQQEEFERQEANRRAQLEAERLDAERQIALKKAHEEAERQEAIRKAQQEAERLEAERQMALKRAQEEAERQEAQRLAQEQARKQEQLKPVPPPAVQRDVVDFSQSRQQQSQEVFQQQQTSFQSSQTFQSSLEHNELSMQIKSGGMMHGDERTGPTQQIDDYVGSLRPTTTGEIIRTPAPDAIYTSNRESVYNEAELYSQANLKRTAEKDPRHSGIFGGIAGDHNSLVDNVGYERHTVQNLVKHFSTTKTGDIPVQFLPQQYMQNSAEAPPLSYLKEQAKSKDFSYKEKSEQTATSTTSTNKKTSFSAEENAENLKLFQRRGSLKDYLMMDLEDRQQSSDQPSILDPSAILQVDGSIEPGLGQRRAQRDSNGREYDSQGRLMDTDKWDNHNTIARGWLTAGEDHYQPVTFRRIYGTKSVAGPSPLPPTPPAPQQPQAEPVEQEAASTPQDEGYADL